MIDSPSGENDRTHADNRYVLRLLVVKMEGVLIEPFPGLSLSGVDGETLSELDVDTLFPNWCDQLNQNEGDLRNSLAAQARSGKLSVDDDLRTLLNGTRNHSPVRVAFLSSGPKEWVQALEEQLDLQPLRDLTFCYDNYQHGTRRTLLQFLMNRFIAGKGRTLLLGNTLNDEELARREKTRFRSFEPAPDGARSPSNWGWSPSDLQSFLEEKQPQE